NIHKMLSMVFIGQMFFSLAFIRRKRLIVFLAITLLLLNRHSFAQDIPNSNYRRLNIGDTVPDISFTVCNFNMPTAKLSDFAGRLVILDFWATWCGSCIKMFPKVDSLQKKFINKVVFILVNSSRSTQDSGRQLHTFFERWQNANRKPFPLITASNDTA